MSHFLNLIYVPCPDMETAKSLAKKAVEKKLAACANILGQGISIYEWQGVMEEATEVYALFKTTPDKAASLKAFLEAAHPYEVPCILTLQSNDVNQSYFDWVSGQVNQ